VDPEAVVHARDAFAETHAAHVTAYCERETLEDLEEDTPDAPRETLLRQARDACTAFDDRMRRKWEDRNDYAAYRLVDERLAEAHRLALILAEEGITVDRFNEDLPDAAAFLGALFEALEVHEIVRLEQAGFTNRSNGIRSLVSLLSSYLRRHRIDADRPEAANLLIPPEKRAAFPGQRFFSPEQVDDAEDDPSLLDPPDSGFWRKPSWPIASFSTTDYHSLGLVTLRKHHDALQFATLDEQAAALLDKDVPVRVVYEPDDLDGRTPKVTVRLGGQDWKLKYVTDRRDVGRRRNPAKIYQKRWQGSEVNVEPVVNNLAAALGYTVDPTYYQERVFLYFPDEVYEGSDAEQEARFTAARAALIEELTGYFPDANVPSAFQHLQIDGAGRRYLEVRGATLEKKSDPLTDVNIGYFIRGGFGRSFKREFRAFGLFLAWIADPDIKDANVKAKLVPVTDAAGRRRHTLVYSASDMGGGLGTGLPNMFPKDLVRGVERDLRGHVRAVELTYRSIFPAPLLGAATLSDARWPSTRHRRSVPPAGRRERVT
jgi:hypothetical protein